MKVTHICLASPFSDGWGYQENILVNIHARKYQTSVITTPLEYDSSRHLVSRKSSDYINDKGVRILALKQEKILGKYRLGKFSGLYLALETLKPDVIFIHGGQFISLKNVTQYCRKHSGIHLFIDQHGDYYNMPVISLKDKIYQKEIFGHQIRKIAKYTDKFWGVTPWRCQYLNDIYGVSKEKIDLLVMGADDQYIHFEKMPGLRKQIRNELNLSEDDFVIISGGKIDETKNIHHLMRAIIRINCPNLKLILFGRPDAQMKDEIDKLCNDPHICYIGWQKSEAVYDYFLASDLAVFPGTHSVLWEQACGCGIPIVVKDWEGMHHVDVGGNCRFLQHGSIQELEETLSEIHDDTLGYQHMKKIAAEKAVLAFSYNDIARRAIDFEKR